MELNVPTGYAQVLCGFSGVALPTGAAITFGLDHTSGSLTPSEVAASVIAAYGTRIKSTISADITLAVVRVKYGPMETGPFADVAANIVGTDTAGADSPNVALLVKKVTNSGGKKGSGRMFVPGLGQTRVTSAGAVQSADLTLRQTAWSGFLTDMAAGATPLVLNHTWGEYVNTKGETIVVPKIVPSPIVGLQVQGTAATQRRRLRR